MHTAQNVGRTQSKFNTFVEMLCLKLSMHRDFAGLKLKGLGRLCSTKFGFVLSLHQGKICRRQSMYWFPIL